MILLNPLTKILPEKMKRYDLCHIEKLGFFKGVNGCQNPPD